MAARRGDTLLFPTPPVVAAHAAIGGKKEGEGPLAACFDALSADNFFGQSSWEAAEKELAAAKDTLMRTAAEYDNFRKRSAREHDAAFDNGVSFAVNTLLPVLDTLEIAADAPTADESYKKGVTMTLDKCREAFGKMGVSEIEAQGKPFDPELHAAVLQQPSTDDMPSGTVTQVMQKGYLLHDKVIRHAAVAVAE